MARGDLAPHGEAERSGDRNKLTQELKRKVEGAGAELVGLVRREEYNVCFSKQFFEDRQIMFQTQILPVSRG